MPGLKLLTKLDAEKCIKIAWRAAQDQGYSLAPTPLADGAKTFTDRLATVLQEMGR